MLVKYQYTLLFLAFSQTFLELSTKIHLQISEIFYFFTLSYLMLLFEENRKKNIYKFINILINKKKPTKITCQSHFV
jgi:hypothetical protein